MVEVNPSVLTQRAQSQQQPIHQLIFGKSQSFKGSSENFDHTINDALIAIETVAYSKRKWMVFTHSL